MTPSAARTVLLAGGLFVAGTAGSGCSDNGGGGAAGSSGTAGSGGSGGGTTGNAGTTGSGGSGGASGGTGGVTPGFMSIAPCPNESDYVTGTAVDFGLIAGAYAYSPKCLHVLLPATGAIPDVTFTGDFGTHPLEPSARRGAQTGNPITTTSTGTSKVFPFSTPGFFAYFCQVHNPSDNGAAMSGVVWATQQIILPLTP